MKPPCSVPSADNNVPSKETHHCRSILVLRSEAADDEEDDGEGKRDPCDYVLDIGALKYCAKRQILSSPSSSTRLTEPDELEDRSSE